MQKIFIAFIFLIVIISSCKLKEDTTGTTDSGGTDNSTTSAIKVVKPNGGESLAEGSSFEINWTGSGMVRIQFSVDNGSTWSLVVDSLKGTGIYTWFPIPNQISNQCRIRVSTIDGVYADASDQVFSIIRNSNKSISINLPKKGDEWEAGSSKQIKWFSSGIDSVKIENTTDNGNHWDLISIDKKNTGIYYWEPVPNTPSTLAKIRIMDAKGGVPSAESDLFSILPEPKLKVLSPNGGERVLASTSRKIEWLSENIENVKLAYTTNNGFNWVTIKDVVPSTGFYIWESVPNVNSQLCKIRIYDAKDGEPNDVSDSTFTITNQISQTVEVTYPNGGEKWQAGTNQSIIWRSSGIPKVKLEFTSNNGLTWNTIVDQLANTGAYEWNIPNSISTQCLLKISDASDGDPIDQTNGLFRIVPKPELKIVKPNGGESWTAGILDTIKWNSVGVENVYIEYTPNNGNNWYTIVEKTPSSGTYLTSFTNPGTQYKIRIIDADNKSPQDESDGTFIVTPEPKINVLSPNGKEEWFAGSSNNIMWNSTNIEDVRIEYTTNNGASWATIVASTPSDGVYSWNPIPDISTLQCRIRISDAKDGIPSDVSDDNFTITHPGIQLIKVKNPNGGETWPSGTSQEIKWDASGITNVKIEYTANNGISWTTITTSTPSTGFYTWNQVPNILSTNCKIRISDAADNSPSDESDAFFSIGAAASVRVLLPNGNDTWLKGSNKEIKWTSENVANVKIEYTTNAGGTWNTIVNSTPSTGSYMWNNLPDANNSLQCRIRVSEAEFGTPSDISDDNFAIMNSGIQEIKVVSPNGAENWGIGSTQNIIWDAGGIANVKIEYTTNNGNSWNMITASTPSNGYYTWSSIPNSQATNCKVRISDASDGTPSDESDAFFIIGPPPSITVITPNGNDTWISGSNKEIKWTSQNVVDVKIEYTSNAGGTWNTIVSSTPSYGTFMWNSIPTTNNSLQCRIRISEADRGVPSDMSDDNFAIMSPGAQQVKVATPNGGEAWTVGSLQNIIWDAGGIANVKIEYTTNNGLNWGTIISSTPSNGYYTWNSVPNTPATNCLIKISDAADGDPVDLSDKTFSILPKPTIKVVSPNGGETIQSGTNSEITWVSENVLNVKIEYTTNGGAVWNVITNSTESTGSYIWTNVPSLYSFQCRIRISDASNGTSSDVSDNNFAITNATIKSLKLTSPNGGESWEAGTIQNITWTSSGVSTVKVELTTDQGSNWQTLADNVAGGAYQWSIDASLNSIQCQIRISDPNTPGVSSISAATFVISPKKSITVTGPISKTYKSNEPVVITWKATGIKYVGIKFTTTNGVADADNPAFTVLTGSEPAASGTYSTYFSKPSSQYYVVVYNADEGSNGTPSNNSPGFIIEQANASNITVLTPNGSEQWLSYVNPLNANRYLITWKASSVENVKIEYSVNGGYSWNQITASTANDGSYSWTPLAPDSSDNCLVKISNVANSLQSDVSDEFFSMHQNKWISIEFPNDKTEYFETSNSNRYPMDIRWTSYAVEFVDIYYSLDNGMNWVQLANGYRSTGAYEWDWVNDPNIGLTTVSTQGRIRIVDHNDSKIWDTNDTPFWLNKREGQGK
jgi:hypothetical protein